MSLSSSLSQSYLFNYSHKEKVTTMIYLLELTSFPPLLDPVKATVETWSGEPHGGIAWSSSPWISTVPKKKSSELAGREKKRRALHNYEGFIQTIGDQEVSLV